MRVVRDLLSYYCSYTIKKRHVLPSLRPPHHHYHEKTVFYSNLGNPSPYHDSLSFCVSLFLSLSLRSGTVSVRRKLQRKSNYRLRVKASIDNVISGYVMVIIRVTSAQKRRPQPRVDQGLKFPSPIYSVIIPCSMVVGQTILHLRVENSKHLKNSTVRYRLQSIDPFHGKPHFSLHPAKGFLRISRELTELVSGDKASSFVLQVVAQTQEKPNVFESTQVSVVVVPDYAGNGFVKSSMAAVKNKSAAVDRSERLRSQKNETFSDDFKSPLRSTEFSVHRMFRRPSTEAQKISKADLQFNKIIGEIKREIATQLIGNLLLVFLKFLLQNFLIPL